MKKLFFIFGLFMMFLTSCGDESDFGETPFSQMPLNQEDSLAMVKIYKEMGCESWSDKNKIDLKSRDKWPGCKLEYNEESQEFRVIGIYFCLQAYFPEYKEPVYNISNEISKLTALESVCFFSDGSVKTANISALANCPILKRLDLLYGEVTEKDLEELPKLSGTLTELTMVKSGLSGSLDWTQEFANLELLNLSSNNYEGKVPGIFKYSNCGVELSGNNFTEMDWSYFTDENVKNIPFLRENRLHGVIPQEVLVSPNWQSLRSVIANQQEGYSFTNWNGH